MQSQNGLYYLVERGNHEGYNYKGRNHLLILIISNYRNKFWVKTTWLHIADHLKIWCQFGSLTMLDQYTKSAHGQVQMNDPSNLLIDWPIWILAGNAFCSLEVDPRMRDSQNSWPGLPSLYDSLAVSKRAGDLTAFIQQIPDTKIVISVNACIHHRFALNLNHNKNKRLYF